ncbi:MAG: hypothetical protein KY432_06645 [Acidobacteria bacterium]|nr:hypothetical protein [Acidobacteriota bacterium]
MAPGLEVNRYTTVVNLIETITGPLADDLEIVKAAALRLGLKVWLVGGPVRDALLEREVVDLDFLVEGRVEELAASVAEQMGGLVREHPAFMTAKFLHPAGRPIDFTTARTETYPEPGVLPVVRPATVQEDLLRRDFSVNAMAFDLQESTLLDPAGGAADLESGLLRILHADSFIDDPTRMFRLSRFAARLQFRIENETQQLLDEALAAKAFQTVSPQRLWRELVICFREPDPASTVASLLRTGVLQSWTGVDAVDPRLSSRLNLLQEACSEMTGLDEEVLFVATLIDSMPGASIPAGLSLSRHRHDLFERLLHESPKTFERWPSLTSDEDRARFCLELSPEEFVFFAIGNRDAREILEICRGVHDQSLPFGGDDLRVPPGPHVGKALRDARVRAWLDPASPEALLEFARKAALRYLSD